jgi:hypothetical protein
MALPYPLTSTKRQRLQQLGQALWTERGTFDAHYRDLADFVKPRRLRSMTSDRNKGDKRNQKIIDSTAGFAHRTLASGLHAGLTSPARPWFIVSTPDPALNRVPAVKAWLHEVGDRMRSIFQQTNLYNALPIVYGDMGLFGTAAMGILQDGRDLFRTYTYPIGSYALGVNARGLVTTFYRELEMTVRQVVENFAVVPGMRDLDWSHVSQRVKDQWERSQYEATVDVCWIVLPNEDADPSRGESRFKPFASVHYEKSTTDAAAGCLREAGYDTFPILCPRWDVTSHEDTYGTDCPGMTALGDVRQLQTQQKKKGQAIAKMVEPSLVGSTSLMTQKVSLLPGDITYEEPVHGYAGLRSIHDVRIDLSHLTADMQEVQYRIQRAFYEDLFLMLANDRRQQPATAREIDERHEEKLLALGPVLERTNDELLDPLIDRTYALMVEARLVPEPPEELDGVTLKVEYISILAQAQKLVGVVSQDRFLNTLASLAQTFPEARHKLNIFQVIDNYADMLGVDPRIVHTNEEAQAAAQQAAEAAQAAQDAETAKSLASAGKSASETSLEGDTALSRMMQNVGAAA